jgi:death-on-curing protein
MSEPIWLELAEVLAIHEKLIAQHGGEVELRDKGLLESALARPMHRYFYESAEIPELAASYAAGIVLNHPFIDGNKRTGFMLAATFIEINEWRFTADEANAVVQTLALATGDLSEAEFAAWLAANSTQT